MKTLLALLILPCLFALPGYSELSDADLDKIRLIVNESEKRIKSEINSEIAESEKRMKEYVDVRINALDKMVQSSESQLKEHVSIKIESVEKRLTLLSNIVIALVALIIVAVGLPQALMAWRNRETQQQINALKREIEILKQQKV